MNVSQYLSIAKNRKLTINLKKLFKIYKSKFKRTKRISS
jgi:hypothetical protein